MISQRIAPKHLNANAFLKTIEYFYTERSKLKPLVKQHPEYKSLVQGFKEAAVCAYGHSGDPNNWKYDPQMRLHICIAGQVSILMLIEALELAGFETFFSNTDGGTTKVPKSRKDEFFQICKEWEEQTTYTLEYVDYKKIIYQDVNNYIAVDIKGNIKKKGLFCTSTFLHKNKSFRVIPLALEQYFINGIKPEEFIGSYTRVYDFCGRSTGSRKTYQHRDLTNNVDLPNLIRYYPTTKLNPNGIKVMKMVRPTATTNAKNTSIEPADYNKIVCNHLPVSDFPLHLSQIDRQWYIDECYKIIKPIELGRKLKKTRPISPNQTSLF